MRFKRRIPLHFPERRLPRYGRHSKKKRRGQKGNALFRGPFSSSCPGQHSSQRRPHKQMRALFCHFNPSRLLWTGTFFWGVVSIISPARESVMKDKPFGFHHFPLEFGTTV